MRYVLGIDIGGTNVVAGCVSEDGAVLHGLRSEPTVAEKGADDVIERILRLAHAAMDETRAIDKSAEIVGVGMGAPGPLDTRRGIVLLTPNLGWRNMPLRERVG